MSKETKETKEEKLVELRIPRGQSNEDPNVFISVNGVNWLLPRGKVSKVPAYIAAEYERGQRARDAYYDTVAQLSGLAE